MNTNLLNTLLLVYRYGSMAEAARRLQLTHGAVAQQIRALEQALQVELVSRAGRAVHLTRAAHRILGHSQKILDDVDMLAALANTDELRGELRLGAGSTSLTGKMPDIFVVLGSRYPNIRVNIVNGLSSSFYQMVENNSIDAAIALEPPFNLSKGLGYRP
jgi:DNA-binding transcriptional LysR family regulator